MIPKDTVSLFISDCHLGCKYSAISELRSLLRDAKKLNSLERVYLVGDIVDGWRLRRTKHCHWSNECNLAIRDILTLHKKGVKVIWVSGNHDDFLRTTGISCPMLSTEFAGITVCDSIVHTLNDGREFKVIHGDQYDVSIRYARWLVLLADRGYDVMLRLNHWVKTIQKMLGIKSKWSLSRSVKSGAKGAVNLIADFHRAVIADQSAAGFDGVICGHIHDPAILESQDKEFTYVNCGDWIDNCTGVAEDRDGNLSIVNYGDKQ